MYWVYILKSSKDNKFYIGSTSNLEKRIKYHNGGKVRSTKSRRPLDLIYSKKYNSVRLARQRENFLKSGQGRKWVREVVLERRSG